MVFSENKSSGGRYRKARNSGYYDIVTFVSGIILIVYADTWNNFNTCFMVLEGDNISGRKCSFMWIQCI